MAIGNYIGVFIKADDRSFSVRWQEYMSIRFRMDVRKSLKRGMQLKLPKGGWTWVHFNYEKMPIFCFFCGVIGHTDRYCKKLFLTPGVLEEKFAFGP